MDLLVVVPHFDDAVFSLGQHLTVWARRSSIHVATIFGCPPNEQQSTPFDEACGFRDSTVAVEARWRENEDALNSLGITSTSVGPFADAQYGEPAEQGTIEGWVDGLIQMLTPSAVVGLLGLRHADHRRLAGAMTGRATHVAEDAPYGALWPEDVSEALERAGALYRSSVIASGPAKEQAVARYPSQLWSLQTPTLLNPERLWRVA